MKIENQVDFKQFCYYGNFSNTDQEWRIRNLPQLELEKLKKVIITIKGGLGIIIHNHLSLCFSLDFKSSLI